MLNRESDTSSLLASGGRMFESLSEEIDVLLKRLAEVDEKMNDISIANPSIATPAVVHTLQRHRDILQDYTQEFRKTQNNLKSRKEREELLQGVKKEIEYVHTVHRLAIVRKKDSVRTIISKNCLVHFLNSQPFQR